MSTLPRLGVQRDYWTLYLANFATAIGMSCFVPFLAYSLERMGVDESSGALPFWTGLVTGAAPLMASLLGPLWGSFGDRYGRKPMVLRALLGIAAFVGLMALARTPWQLFALRLGQGTFSGFVAPSLALVSLKAPEGKQGKSVASIQSATILGFCVGPLLGATIRQHFGEAWVYVVCASIAAVSALCVWLWVEEPEAPRSAWAGGPFGVFAEVGRAIAAMLRDPMMRTLLVVLFAMRFAIASTDGMLALFVKGDLAPGEPDRANWIVGLSFTGPAIAGVFAVTFWGWLADRRHALRVLRVCCLGAGLGYIPLVGADSTWMLVGSRFVIGGFFAGVLTLGFPAAAALTKKEARGGSFGLVFSALGLALALGPGGAGVLAGLAGSARPGFALAMVLCFGGAALLSLPRIRRAVKA